MNKNAGKNGYESPYWKSYMKFFRKTQGLTDPNPAESNYVDDPKLMGILIRFGEQAAKGVANYAQAGAALQQWRDDEVVAARHNAFGSLPAVLSYNPDCKNCEANKLTVRYLAKTDSGDKR